ncbi:HK97 gp10 family phage protein [Escherichia coli]
MADSIEFKLEGVDSLLGKLEAITTETKRKTGRSALRKAGNVIVTQIKRNAERLDDPQTARSIADNAALRWNGRMFKQTGDLAFRIGILQGAVLKKHPSTAKDAPTPHWRLLEFGTEKMAAKPLVRAAANSRLIEVFNTFAVNYEAGIDRAIKRAQKKGEIA